MFFSRHPFSVIITILCILAVLSSIYRFFIASDYLVKYEISCDPYTEDCYTYCEDEACSEPWYYKYAIVEAEAISDACGPDITECEAAELCTENSLACKIEYCAPGDERCETLTKTDMEVTEDFFEAFETLKNDI